MRTPEAEAATQGEPAASAPPTRTAGPAKPAAGAGAYDRWQSLPAAFFEQARTLADRPFLWAKREDAWRSWSWRETADTVRALAAGLRDLGVGRGDRVMLVAENRPEFMVADLAIMAIGGITVPGYTTSTVADHGHVLNDSGAVAAIVSTRALARRVLPAAADARACRIAVTIEAPGSEAPAAGVELHDWQAVVERGSTGAEDVEAASAGLGRDDTACFIYTSGTGGAPKGVMLSHRNIFANCRGAYRLLESFGLGDEVFLSFLPLSHAYEHTAGQFFPMTIGAEIYYASGIEYLLSELAEVRPTVMTAVPRLYETMHARLLRNLRRQSRLRQRLFWLAVSLGRKRYEAPGSLGSGERLLDRVVDRLVRDKVRARFGGRLKAMVSGGAALNPEIGVFFHALGLTILQGYGQTESSPVVSCNPPSNCKMHTVGPPLEGVEVKIAEDGEILVRGDLVMQGYWNAGEATRRALKDGWLHTGDVGQVDEDGYIQITDRKKDIVVLSGGDSLSPARVEGMLTLEPEVAQAMVYGDKRPHLVALLVPDEEFLKTWAREHRKPADLPALAGDSEFQDAMAEVVERVNGRLAMQERVRRFALASEPFTVDNDMMTPTLKVRRHKIKERYGDLLERLY